jgi:predicted  nucleic acid-binding Zn-ribbon protein
MEKKSTSEIAHLTAIVERGFAALTEDIADAKENIADIRNTMATKADVQAIVHEELSSIRAELKSIRTDLDDLTEKFENVLGYRKEIDHALERISAIEKHLGLDKKKIAA